MKNDESTSWDKYIEDIRQEEGVSKELKSEVIDAYSFLREIFGEKFLTIKNKNHGVARKVYESGPPQLKNLVSFVRTLKELKTYDSNYNILLSKLKPRDRSNTEGVPMVEVARMALSSGLRIKVEPDVEHIKKPDFEFSDPETGEVLYGELTTLDDSDERKRRSYTHRLLFKLLEMTPPYLPFACRVTKPFDESDASQIREFVTNCKSKVIKAASFEIFEEKHFVLGLVCEEKIDEVRTWAERSNLTIYNIDGLELDYDDSRRIAGNKIVEKASQLPRSNDGLIIVRVKPLSFWGGELRNTIDMVRERLKNRPHVLGAIVYSTLGHRQEPGLRRFEGGFLRITQLSDGIIQYTLFILNLNDSQKISDATLIKVLGLR